MALQDCDEEDLVGLVDAEDLGTPEGIVQKIWIQWKSRI